MSLSRAEGLLFTHFYVQPICTPSRASFFTGRYPLAYGLQGKQTVQQGCPWGLDLVYLVRISLICCRMLTACRAIPIIEHGARYFKTWFSLQEEQTFVSAFQQAGWATHMVGKAHIGVLQPPSPRYSNPLSQVLQPPSPRYSNPPLPGTPAGTPSPLSQVLQPPSPRYSNHPLPGTPTPLSHY